MVYDNYLDLSGMDLVPFVDSNEKRLVQRVVYQVENADKCYLDLWIQSERNGYYMYAMLYTFEAYSWAFGIAPLEMKKVHIADKFGRGTSSAYHSAGMKASIFGKQMIKQLFPHWEINWEPYKTWNKPMSTMPAIAKYAPECIEETFYFDERKVFGYQRIAG